MSPWWREQFQVRLAPGEVGIARWSRGPRRTFLDSETLVTGDGPGAPWQPAVDALARFLQARRARGTDLRVEASGHFCRWMLLPPDDAIATDAEWHAYARASLEGVHGDRARGWEFRLGAQRAGESVPLCAMDRALLDQLRLACTAGGVRLAGVTTAFATAFDRHRSASRAPRSAFALLETGRCTLGVLARGRWVHLSSVRCGTDFADVLLSQLAGPALQGVSASTPGRLQVAAAEGLAALPGRLGSWEVVRLDRGGQPGPGSRVEAGSLAGARV
ncbi:MAG: hypothetical protein WCJ69_13705 [Betaproteobacteria bacterium]